MRSTSIRQFCLALVLILLMVSLSACSQVASPQPSQPGGESTQPVGSEAYPADQLKALPQDNSQYPAASEPGSVAKNVPLEKVVAPKDAPKPEAGKGSASGILYSRDNHTILGLFRFYFTPAQGEGDEKTSPPPVLVGPFAEKGDIIVVADDKGVFQVTNMPPGNYYMVLEAPGDYQYALTSPTDEKPRMVTFKADEAQSLGVILFP